MDEEMMENILSSASLGNNEDRNRKGIINDAMQF